MSYLRNRFLNSSALLFAPPDPPADGGAQDAGDAGGDNQDDAGGDGETLDAGATGDDDTVAEGDDADGETGDDDEDPELAALSPEAREAAKKFAERQVARETGWRDRQLNKLHGKMRAAQEDVAAAGTIVEGRTAPAAKPGEDLTAEQIEARAKTLATQMTAQDKYDNDANDADAKGRAAYGDKWTPTLAKLPKLGGVDLPDMQDILSTDKPHVVLYQLSDPETYERVMALPPARRRNEFVKLAMKPEPKPVKVVPESKRPGEVAKPSAPLQNGRKVAAQTVNLSDDKVSDEAWYAQRNATRRKKFSDHV